MATPNGKRKALDDADLMTTPPRGKTKGDSDEEGIHNYVFACKKDPNSKGRLYYWNVVLKEKMVPREGGEALAASFTEKMRMCEAIWKPATTQPRRDGSLWTLDACLKVKFKTRAGFDHAKSIWQDLAPSMKLKATKDESLIEEWTFEVEKRGDHAYGVIGDTFDADQWFTSKCVGKYDHSQNAIIVPFADAEDGQVVLGNIKKICTLLGYTMRMLWLPAWHLLLPWSHDAFPNLFWCNHCVEVSFPLCACPQMKPVKSHSAIKIQRAMQRYFARRVPAILSMFMNMQVTNGMTSMSSDEAIRDMLHAETEKMGEREYWHAWVVDRSWYAYPCKERYCEEAGAYVRRYADGWQQPCQWCMQWRHQRMVPWVPMHMLHCAPAC